MLAIAIATIAIAMIIFIFKTCISLNPIYLLVFSLKLNIIAVVSKSIITSLNLIGLLVNIVLFYE